MNRVADGWNQFPADLPGFEDAVWRWYGYCETLAYMLLEALGEALGKPRDALTDAFGAEHTSFLRLNHYPASARGAPADAPDLPEGELGIHHHTDAGVLTLLVQEGDPGLQVRHGGAWHLVCPEDDAFVVNIGDMMQVFANDAFLAPEHRVLATRPGGARQSAAFFFNPAYDAVIAPFAATPHYRPFTWGECPGPPRRRGLRRSRRGSADRRLAHRRGSRERMRILIYRDSYEAVQDALAARPEVEALLMEDDGSVVTPDGAAADDTPFEAAWLSRHLFLKPGAPITEYVKKVLRTPGVKWLQSGAAGYEHPTFQRILAAGIRLSINDGSSVAIAEYVLAQVMAAFHPGQERLAAQARHEWVRMPFRELRGSRWLILGYGSIGRHVAERAKAFGAEIVGIRRTPRPDDRALRVVGVDALEEEIAAADVFVICAAANDGNAHIVDAGLLARMKPEAVLVNVARGSLVDEAALVAALDEGRPGLAVLDVFETEPLPEDSPLWDHPRVRVTAHCAPDTDATGERGDAVFLEHLDAYLAGKPLRLEVKP